MDTVPPKPVTDAAILQGFANRLNELCDEEKIPIEGRQAKVGKMFGVSQKGARKWLKATGMPTTVKLAQIAIHFNVASEWLRTGRGDKRIITTLGPKHRKLIEAYDRSSPTQRQVVDLTLHIE